MKYINLIFILLFSLLLFSCGKKEVKTDNNQQNQTQQNYIPDTNAMTPEEKQIAKTRKEMLEELKPEKTVTPIEAKNYVGRVVKVTGYVAEIYKTEKAVFLNFEEKYPKNPFCGVIFAEKVGMFDPDIFLHRQVELTGRIALYNNKPEIIMRSQYQILILK